MTEQKLKDYFEDNLSAEQLSLDLKGSQQKTGYDVTTVSINSLNEGEFEIRKEHLIKLCDDTISRKLLLTDLNTIGFALMSSDFFNWDSDTKDGEIIANIIFEWDNPEIGFDITTKNVKLWKEYLLTGVYRLDKNELKEKFRSKRNITK